MFGGLDQICCKLVGIEYLPVVEHSFYWRQSRAAKEIYLLGMVGYGTLQCLQAMIDGITFQQIVVQDLIGPSSELYTPA